MAIQCKRIIDGKTYNTETATMIAGGFDAHSHETGKYLYQTRFGAFFVYSYVAGAGEDDYERIEPLTPQQAQEWLEKHESHNVALIEQLFGQMPEAGSGEVKYTLRMPESLRDLLAARAKANNQSLNAWIIRCLESCTEAVSNVENGDQRDIPPMGNMVGSNRAGWRTRGT
jgi:predicted HicB family RNase H-like nuclease